jgi:hypothetical protein
MLPLRVFFASFKSRKRNVARVWPQDHILPVVADERHAPDTWFLVWEEDWRLRAEHGNVNPLTFSATGEATYGA